MRESVEVAEHHHAAIFFGKAGNLIVKRRAKLGPIDMAIALEPDHRRLLDRGALARATDRGIRPSPDRNAMSHAMKPRPNQIRVADRPSLLDQDKERRLERIIAIVPRTKNAPTNAKDHRPMTTHKRLKGQRIAKRSEPTEQFRLIKPDQGPPAREEPSHLPDRRAKRNARHDKNP